MMARLRSMATGAAMLLERRTTDRKELESCWHAAGLEMQVLAIQETGQGTKTGAG